MATGPTYVVKFRRRREGKTNYKKRLSLLKSRKPRFVIRKSIYNFTIQTVLYEENGDRVLLTTTSKELYKKYGWKYHRNNIPSAYLTAYLHGLKSLKAGIKEGIIDIGLHRKSKGSSIFAAVKGLIDSGVKIPHSDILFPDDKRIKGYHISSYASYLKEKDYDKYKRQFSRYLSIGVDPENIPTDFDSTLKKIIESFR